MRAADAVSRVVRQEWIQKRHKLLRLRPAECMGNIVPTGDIVNCASGSPCITGRALRTLAPVTVNGADGQHGEFGSRTVNFALS
jgi:hypothetical protein